VVCQGYFGIKPTGRALNVTEGTLEQPNAAAQDTHDKMKLRRKYAGEALTELGVLIFFFLPGERAPT
jgi:hypothetical protein